MSGEWISPLNRSTAHINGTHVILITVNPLVAPELINCVSFILRREESLMKICWLNAHIKTISTTVVVLSESEAGPFSKQK